jgi:hypothetical protein
MFGPCDMDRKLQPSFASRAPKGSFLRRAVASTHTAQASSIAFQMLSIKKFHFIEFGFNM